MIAEKFLLHCDHYESKTCLRRKIKCDCLRPICNNCIRSDRKCEKQKVRPRFIFHGVRIEDVLLDEVTFPTEVQSNSISDLTRRLSKPLQDIESLSVSSPRTALENSQIAELFAHYVTFLAAWYDLNDAQLNFTTTVPLHALENPILFKAIIAFSASHLQKTTGQYAELAAAFHSACIRELLQFIQREEPDLIGDCLGATCLLRSYEILNGDSRRDQRHLLGAYSFVAYESFDLKRSGLLQAGAWNYLREEITVALECRRPVRMSANFSYEDDSEVTDDMFANAVSYHLAHIAKACFSDFAEQASLEDRVSLWKSFRTDLRKWKESLPASFHPFSNARKPGDVFHPLWMLQPWHIAGQQYYSVAEILLTVCNPSIIGKPLAKADQDFVEEHALRVCGLASTNKNVAAWVNAFGPLAFCGRFLMQAKHREALEALLIEMSHPVGWPIEPIIRDLKVCWQSN